MFKPKANFLIALIIITCLPIRVDGLHFARWHTTLGDFTATLRDEIVPITANNFINLTNSGFYDGLIFHRVVEGFVIQDGCPLGTGYGGPGYTIPDEFSPLLHHDSPGVLAMARTSQPNSAGSQYYITLVPTPHLDGNYAIFGKVFEGLDVVMAIGNVPVDANNHPVNDVYIDSLRVLDLVIYNVSPPPDTVVIYDLENPFPFVVEAFNPDLSVQISWYVDDVLQQGASDIMFTPVFANAGEHTVKCVTSTDEISWTTIWQVQVWVVANEDPVITQPDLKMISLSPNPFYGSTSLNFYLDKAKPVQIMIYDSKGRLIQSTWADGKTGYNSFKIDGKSQNGQRWASGIYLIKIKNASDTVVQKAVFLK